MGSLSADRTDAQVKLDAVQAAWADAEADIFRLRSLISEVVYAGQSDVAAILAETRWYERAKTAIGMVPADVAKITHQQQINGGG